MKEDPEVYSLKVRDRLYNMHTVESLEERELYYFRVGAYYSTPGFSKLWNEIFITSSLRIQEHESKVQILTKLDSEKRILLNKV